MRFLSFGHLVAWHFTPLVAILILSSSLALGQDKKNESPSPPNPLRAQKTGDSDKPTQQSPDGIEFKRNHKGPVFVYDTVGGGQVGQVAGVNKSPKFQVFADGKVTTGGVLGVPELESEFSKQQLQEFLDFVVNQQRIYELDTDDLKRRMAGKEKQTLVDATSSVFIVDLKKGKTQISVYALYNAIQSFPNFDEIKRLSAIEKRCVAEISKIHLGGEGDKALKWVNDEIKKRNLGLAPFTLDEMRLASRMANGRFQVSFHREHPDQNVDQTGPPKMIHAIYFVKDAKSEPTVMMYNLPTNK